MTRLEGRSALVSGGGQGIGRAVAHRLVQEGATVTVVDLNAGEGESCVESLRAAGGQATFVKANIAKLDEIEAAVGTAADFGSGLDILINTAQYFAMPKAVQLVSEKDWELSEATGPKASFRFMKLAYPHLDASEHASVINFTSGSALMGIAFTAPYSAAKGAVVALTKVAANEWAERGIRVNAICPFALTEPQRKMIGTEFDNYSSTAAMSPQKRGGDPETDVAPAVAFLASDDAKFITGTVLHVDGGLNELSPIDYRSFPGIYDA